MTVTTGPDGVLFEEKDSVMVMGRTQREPQLYTVLEVLVKEKSRKVDMAELLGPSQGFGRSLCLAPHPGFLSFTVDLL